MANNVTNRPVGQPIIPREQPSEAQRPQTPAASTPTTPTTPAGPAPAGVQPKSSKGLAKPADAKQARDTAPASSTKKLSASDKLKDKKASSRGAPSVHRQHRAPRPHNAGGAAATAGGDEHGEDAGGGSHSVGGAESADELHRRRGGDVEALWEAQREEEVEEVEGHETGATGADSIKRSKGSGDQGSSDGFDDGQQQREAYERLMKGNVKSDAQRFDELRRKGLKDGFIPESPPAEVERQGVPRLAAHIVRLFDKWTLDGVPRDESVEKMALWLSQLSTPQAIRKVLAELESKPIRDVYPLELLMHLLEHRPELLPNVKKGAVLGNLDDLNSSKKIFAGHSIQLKVPADTRLKSLALLGGVRPGYEFFPTPNTDDRYTLLIDTPGRWTFALLAVPLVSLGRISKEGTDSILELFQVTVNAMGKKGEPVSPEEWLAQQVDEIDEGQGDDDVGAVADGPVEPAALLILQIRKALELIRRDEPETTEGRGPAAATYSWDLRLYAPNTAVDGEGILHLVVERAGPFDPVWHKAREAIIQKQREHEPSRALLTQEDLANAIRRARVRE
ncbi:MAG: hypothetical protein Q8O67_11525 [Deltaproteobacteria bacterium]|nr:hypothetical protein [Deltaproteobacteria bacterium]